MPVPMTGFVISPLMQRSFKEVLRASYVCMTGRFQIMFPHAADLLHWTVWLLPYKSHGKKKAREVRDFIIILSSLFPLSHVTHSPCIINIHGSSYSQDVSFMSLPHLKLHTSLYIHGQIPIFPLRSSPPSKEARRGAGKGGGGERQNTEHASEITQ